VEIKEEREKNKRIKKNPPVPNHKLFDHTRRLVMEGLPRQFQCYPGSRCFSIKQRRMYFPKEREKNPCA
jgi:hypothetical protein